MRYTSVFEMRVVLGGRYELEQGTTGGRQRSKSNRCRLEVQGKSTPSYGFQTEAKIRKEVQVG